MTNDQRGPQAANTIRLSDDMATIAEALMDYCENNVASDAHEGYRKELNASWERVTKAAKDNTAQIKVNVDVAEVMSQITPETLAVFDKSVTDMLQDRVRRAELAFQAIHKTLTTEQPAIACTIWLDKSVSPNCTLADFVALECQAICHPDLEFDPNNYRIQAGAKPEGAE